MKSTNRKLDREKFYNAEIIDRNLPSIGITHLKKRNRTKSQRNPIWGTNTKPPNAGYKLIVNNVNEWCEVMNIILWTFAGSLSYSLEWHLI